jgi:hypothetical protein
MSELQQVFVIQTVLLAAVGFLCRSIINHWLSKDVERFQDRLRADQEAQLRQLQHSLDLARLEHQVRFSRLYDTRFLRIEELHRDSRALVDALADALRVDQKTQLDRIMSAHMRVHLFQNKLKLYEIFLPRDFVDEWDSELSKMWQSLHRLASATSDPTRLQQPQLRDSVDEIASSLRRLNGELADRARSILEESAITGRHTPTPTPPNSAK